MPTKRTIWPASAIGGAIAIVAVIVAITSAFLFMAMPAGSDDPSATTTGYYPSSTQKPSRYPTSVPTGSYTERPTATPFASSTGTASPSGELEDFVRDCEESTAFREGQISLPKEMRLRVTQSGSYSAAVDIQTDPAPPETQIDSPNPRSEPIKVQCVLSARLVPVGDGIEVVPSTDADGDGWRTLKFTPNGVVEWSWTVKPVHPVDQQVRLELVPAVRIEVNSRSIVVNSSANYTTNVKVDATTIDKLSYWFGTQWKLLAGIAAVVGTAFLAILAFSSKAKEAFLTLFKRRPAEDKAAAASPDKPKKKGKK